MHAIFAADATLPPDAAQVHHLSEHLVAAEVPPPVPAAGEVLIKVAASAVNPADILQSRGHYPPPPGASEILGLECAGEIAELGPSPTGKALMGAHSEPLECGQQVCALLSGGGYGEYVCVPAGQVLPIPHFAHDDARGHYPPATLAASIVESAAASLMVLSDIGRLRGAESQVVMIHGASGSVGSIAVQIARLWGHQVYGTAGSAGRCARVEELGAEACFDYHEDWVSAFRARASGGADLIMDVIGAAGLGDNVRALARGGILALLGLLKGARGEINLGALIGKNGQLIARTLRSQPEQEKARICRAVFDQVWPALESGEIKPCIGAVVHIQNVAEAHALLAGKPGGSNTDRHGRRESGRPFGKVVMIHQEDR